MAKKTRRVSPVLPVLFMGLVVVFGFFALKTNVMKSSQSFQPADEDTSSVLGAEAPAAPLNLKPASGYISPGSTTVSWRAVSGATGYLVKIDDRMPGSKVGACPPNKGTDDRCLTITNGTTVSTSYNFKAGRRYYITVQAYKESTDNVSLPTKSDISVLIPAPANLKPANNSTITAGSKSITWNQVPGASGYLLRIDNRSEGALVGACGSPYKGPYDVCKTLSGQTNTSYSYNFISGSDPYIIVSAYVASEDNLSTRVNSQVHVE